MKKLLSLVAVIALAVITANAAQDGAAASTKPWIHANQAPAAKVQAGPYSTQRMCSLCKVPETIHEQIGTKPGHGTTLAVVNVDRCPGCGTKVTTVSKQAQYIHTCTSHCCGA